MTISNTANKVIYLGNGAQTSFQFLFPGVASADISVIITDSLGNETVLNPGQYVLALNPPATNQPYGVGGTVIYNTTSGPLPGGSSITILRELPLTQETSLQNQGSMWPEVVEAALDYLTMITQQLSELFGRALAVSVTDPVIPNSLPPVAQRAGQLLGFDAFGQPIAAQPASALVSTAMQPVVAAASLSAAQKAMGLRQVLTAPLTLYVSPTGNNANDGLSPGNSLATIQFAVNLIADKYDINGFLATIQLAQGTYHETVFLKTYVGSYLPTQLGTIATATEPRIYGDAAHPELYIIDGGGVGGIGGADVKTPWFIHGLTLNNGGIFGDWQINLNLGTINYGPVSGSAAQVDIRYGSFVEFIRGCTSTITAGAANFASASVDSTILVQSGGHNIVLQGTPAFLAFAQQVANSYCDLSTATFIGNATGLRFLSADCPSLAGVKTAYLEFPGDQPADFVGRVPLPTFDWYVSPTGSDTTGTGTALHPFATATKAYAYLQQSFDCINGPIIHLADGVYSAPGAFTFNGSLTGTASITYATLLGDTVNPISCVLNPASGDAIDIGEGATVKISGVSINGVNGIAVYDRGYAWINGSIIFGTCSNNHIQVSNGGQLNLNGSYTIFGNAINHVSALAGDVFTTNAVTITFPGAVTFASAFLDAQKCSVVDVSGVIYTNPGNVTGRRFTAGLNGVVNTGTGTPNTALPGTIVGATSQGGQAN